MYLRYINPWKKSKGKCLRKWTDLVCLRRRRFERPQVVIELFCGKTPRFVYKLVLFLLAGICWNNLIFYFSWLQFILLYSYYIKYCKIFAKSPIRTDCLIILHSCWDFVLLVAVTLSLILACLLIWIFCHLDFGFVVRLELWNLSVLSTN